MEGLLHYPTLFPTAVLLIPFFSFHWMNVMLMESFRGDQCGAQSRQLAGSRVGKANEPCFAEEPEALHTGSAKRVPMELPLEEARS